MNFSVKENKSDFSCLYTYNRGIQNYNTFLVKDSLLSREQILKIKSLYRKGFVYSRANRKFVSWYKWQKIAWVYPFPLNVHSSTSYYDSCVFGTKKSGKWHASIIRWRANLILIFGAMPVMTFYFRFIYIWHALGSWQMH